MPLRLSGLLQRRLQGADYLVEIFYNYGVRDLISLPGAQVLPIWDAIHRSSRLKITVPNNEWNAIWMAAGYNLAGMGPALVCNTIGPGALNELPALASLPRLECDMILLLLEQPRIKWGRIGQVFQGLSLRQSHRPILDHSYLIKELPQIAATLESIRIDPETCSGSKGFFIEYPRLMQPCPVPDKPKTAALREATIQFLVLGSSKFLRQTRKGLHQIPEDHCRAWDQEKWHGQSDSMLAIARGFLLASKTGAVLCELPIQQMGRSLDTLIPIQDAGIAITFLSINQKLAEIEKLHHFKSLLPASYQEGALDSFLEQIDSDSCGLIIILK